MVRLLQRIPFWSLQVNGEPCVGHSYPGELSVC
jgi:hypothetical protein